MSDEKRAATGAPKWSAWISRWLIAPLAFLVRHLFGQVRWTPPAWIGRTAAFAGGARSAMRRHPRRAAGGLLLALALGAAAKLGHDWWRARPRPVEVAFKVTPPARTAIESEIPEERKPKPAVIAFEAPVAPLAAVGKDVTEGLSISPAIAGTWHWDDDKTLAFVPKDDWPAGTAYKVDFGAKLFKPEARAAQDRAEFSSAAFEAKVVNASFYEDPTNPAIKRAVIDLAFTYPVDPAELERRIRLHDAGKEGGVLGLGRQDEKFTVTYDRFKLTASVQSENLPVPANDGSLEFTLAKGLTAARGSPPVEADLTAQVTIPGRYSLHIDDVTPNVVTNQQNEPEQVLVVQTSRLVHERELQPALSVWVLPKTKPSVNGAPPDTGDWSVEEVTDPVLRQATKLDLQSVPSEQEYTDLHSFKFRADVGANLYVQVNKGVKSFGGYVLGKTDGRVVKVPPFPAELKILSQGSLLALSGEKKVAVVARDVPGVKIEIGRLLPNQLQHLVSQSSGDFSKPEFSDGWRFGPDNLTERFERKLPLPDLEHGKPHYEAIDLGEYLQANGGRRGVFLLTVSSYDPKADEQAAADKAKSARRPGEAARDDGEQESCDGCGNEGTENGDGTDPAQPPPPDKRLILVTDLGILTKKSVDGSQDIYVQSIHTGKPVDGASIEIIAKNGTVLFSQTSDAAGHAHFAKIEGLAREKAPLMVVVRKDGDLSFLPFNRADRGLDMSRFDIGGAKNAAVADQLTAYLFSDRGIYRPGETLHVGAIAKPASWGTDIAGLPLVAEVLDPRGLTVKRETVKLPPGGFFETTYTTTEDAPTGTYSVNLYLARDGEPGNLIGSTTVKVREFLPDRMKVGVRLSSEPGEGWISPRDLKALVNVQNLFGTPAQHRRVAGELTLSPAFPTFKRYPDYKFYDPQRAKEGYNATLGDQTTDEHGDATFDLGLSKYARATYQVRFIARAFEPEGGRGVAAQATALVSELPYLVGFKADGDLAFVSRGARRGVSLIALDPAARKTAVNGLTLRLVERKYVSVLVKQPNNTYKYESRRKDVTLKETPLAIAAGGADLPLATDTPGNYAYVIRDAQGLELNRIEYAVAGKGNVTRSLERNAELQLTLNKADYVPGEEIEVSIRAPYAGAGLITIERDKVYVHQWFKTDTLASVQKIRLPKDFEGNGYISVQFVRDPASDEIFMSPLSYGAVPFATSLAARTDKLALTVPDLVKPGETMKMKLTAAKPAKVVVFAVDEGILQVARYQNPDPLSLFFQKRMLEVRTSQILDLILPEFKKLMEASAPGGDDDAAASRHLNPFKRKHDRPAVYWSGIVDVDGSAEFSYQVPDTFNGSMRVLAVAVNDTSVGTAAARTTVRGDLVLSPNVPLAVAPGDEFDVTVGVANNVAKSGKDATAQVTLALPPPLEAVGGATRQVKIPEMGESSAAFRVRAAGGAGAKLGSVPLVFTASLGGKSARLATEVSVRPATPRYAELVAGSFTGSADVPLGRTMYPQLRVQEASVSALPLALTPGLASYLANFSYLCTEQLMSQTVPALVLDKRPEFARPGQHAPLARSVDDALRLLRTRQNAQGGFGMWGANVQADEFASVYATHVLLEARERGVAIPGDLLDKALAYTRELAASPASDLPALRVRAYAAYLMTRQMNVATPAIAAIRESLEKGYPKEWRTDLAAGYLAAAYQLQKQERQASELIDFQVRRLVAHPQRTADGPFFMDPLADDAQTLYLLARHFPNRAKRLPAEAMTALVKPLQENRYNTLSSAYLILAFDAYANVVGPETAGKLGIAVVDRSGAARQLALPNDLVPRAPFDTDAKAVRFTNGARGTTYYAVTQTGFDRDAPTTELRRGLEVLREYVDAAGKPVASVQLGDEVTVRLKFRAVGRDLVPNVALVDLLPGGFEAVADAPAPETADAAQQQQQQQQQPPQQGQQPDAGGTLPGLAGSHSSWQIRHADVREDRVVLIGDVGKDAAEITYKIKATSSGRFMVPPAYAESMYERGVQGRSASGQPMVVTRPAAR